MPKRTIPDGKINKYTKLPHAYMEILKYTAIGCDKFETGKKVGLAPKTVENYLYDMRCAFKCKNTVDLVVRMIRSGAMK